MRPPRQRMGMSSSGCRPVRHPRPALAPLRVVDAVEVEDLFVDLGLAVAAGAV